MAKNMDAKKIKDKVRAHYAEAIKMAPDSSSCCCGSSPAQGKFAAMAGYQESEVQNIPEGLDLPSFGCGNPVDFIEVKSGDTVLDLGSGAGLDLFLAARKVGPTGHVIGIDMTPEMIERARSNIAKAGATNIEVRHGEMEKMPVDDNSIDWVISNCVINLSPEKEKVFAEIFRVLKPGGHMVVSDIVAVGEIPEAIQNDMPSWAGCIGGAVPEKKYLQIASDAGLTDVKVVGRMQYDRSQLTTLASCGCGSDSDSCLGPKDLEALSGKLASVKVAARKPSH
jgi:arsenite methyltransferase